MRLDLLWEDFLNFLFCLKNYSLKRLRLYGFRFEAGKDLLVDLLTSRRGKHSHLFLNLSLSILVVVGLFFGPVFANSYSLSKEMEEFTPPSAVLGALTTAVSETQTTVSDKPRDQVMIYKVQKGDTLSVLAEKFGVSMQTIKWANNLKDDDLTVGDELKVPPVTGIVHKVKAGDTVYSLAKYYKTDTQKIVNFPFNDFTDLETFALNIGQNLIIPDGVMPEAKAIVYSTPVMTGGGGNGQFAWPVGGLITQYPVWYHNALDVADPSAPGIAAAGGGIVSVPAFMRYGYGNYIIIDHGNGLSTLYAHLSEIYVSSGQSVGRGQIIGRMGSTGRSTGTHLHFEVRQNGIIVNPLPFLK